MYVVMYIRTYVRTYLHFEILVIIIILFAKKEVTTNYVSRKKGGPSYVYSALGAKSDWYVGSYTIKLVTAYVEICSMYISTSH